MFDMNVLYSVVYGEDAEFYGAAKRTTFGEEEENEYMNTLKEDIRRLVE